MRQTLYSMIKNTLNEHTTRLYIDTVSSLQTKYGIRSRAGSAREYYDDLSLNATQLLWLMPLASQYLLLVLYNVQAYIKMLSRVTC